MVHRKTYERTHTKSEKHRMRPKKIYMIDYWMGYEKQSISSVSGMTHEFSMNVSINQVSRTTCVFFSLFSSIFKWERWFVWSTIVCSVFTFSFSVHFSKIDIDCLMRSQRLTRIERKIEAPIFVMKLKIRRQQQNKSVGQIELKQKQWNTWNESTFEM